MQVYPHHHTNGSSEQVIAKRSILKHQWIQRFQYKWDGNGARRSSEANDFKEATILRDVLQHYNYTLVHTTICPWLITPAPELELTWEQDLILLSNHHKLSKELQHCISQIKFFLHLNQQERSQLLGPSASPTPKDWIAMIASHSNNLSAIFYYISLNPSLLEGRIKKINAR